MGKLDRSTRRKPQKTIPRVERTTAEGPVNEGRFQGEQVLSWSLLVLSLSLWFGPTICFDQRLSFRDVSHFYLPLYEYLTQRIWSGDFPAWNPLINTGISVVGDNTSALFYPGRWIFLLPISTESALGWYCVLHVILAFCGARYAGRWAGVPREYLGIVGLGYALSAPVVQLYTNPPFLVGAAWLPFAVSGLWQTWVIGSRRAIAVAATALAMPVLGGDPQASLHAVLVGVACGIVKWLRERKPNATVTTSGSDRRGRPVLAFLVAGGLSFVATLVQILPTADWAKNSGRSSEGPPGVSRILAHGGEGKPTAPWYANPPRDSHETMVYNFSAGLWNVPEFLFPHLMGPSRPINGHLSMLLFPDEMYWVTTFFCGTFFGLCGCALLWHGWKDLWFWLFLGALLLAGGGYGVAYWIQWCGSQMGAKWLSGIQPAIGSPYWLLVTLVPLYASFRYPAKWLPLAILGLTVAAARWFGNARPEQLRSLGKLAWIIVSISALLLALTWSPFVWNWAAHRNAIGKTVDMYFGQLQLAYGFLGTRIALLHGGFAIALLGVIIPRSLRTRSTSQLSRALSVFLVADLLIAGTFVSQWVEKVGRQRQELVHLPAELADRWKASTGAIGGPSIFRAEDHAAMLDPWLRTASPERLTELDINDQRTMIVLWCLTHRVNHINATSSIKPFSHISYWRTVNQNIRWQAEPAKAWTNAARWMSVEAAIAHGQPNHEQGYRGERLMLTLPQWDLIPNPLPIGRWYSQAEPLPSSNPELAWRELLPRIFADPDRCPLWLDPREVNPPTDDSQAQIRWREAKAESVSLEVQSTGRGWLYLHIFQDGNWRARIRQVNRISDAEQSTLAREETPIVANLVGQAIELPAGEYQVDIYYTTPWLIPGIIGSIIGWLAIGYMYCRGVGVTGWGAKRLPQIEGKAVT